MIILQILGFILTPIFFIIFHINAVRYLFVKIKFSKSKEAFQSNRNDMPILGLNPFDIFRVFDSMTIVKGNESGMLK